MNVVRCSVVSDRDSIKFVLGETGDRSLCNVLAKLETALRSLGYALVYLAYGVERAYRKGDILVVIDYVDCTVETSATCDELTEIYRQHVSETKVFHT